MGVGQMRTFMEIVSAGASTDSEGFAIAGDTILASLRAYRESRHGTQVWANRAAFSQATDLFRFRKIPGLIVTTAHTILCDGDRFDIISVEDVKGRGMYVEVLAQKVEAARG